MHPLPSPLHSLPNSNTSCNFYCHHLAASSKKCRLGQYTTAWSKRSAQWFRSWFFLPSLYIIHWLAMFSVKKFQSSKSVKPLTLMACFVDCSDGRSWADRDVWKLIVMWNRPIACEGGGSRQKESGCIMYKWFTTTPGWRRWAHCAFGDLSGSAPYNGIHLERVWGI